MCLHQCTQKEGPSVGNHLDQWHVPRLVTCIHIAALFEEQANNGVIKACHATINYNTYYKMSQHTQCSISIQVSVIFIISFHNSIPQLLAELLILIYIYIINVSKYLSQDFISQ